MRVPAKSLDYDDRTATHLLNGEAFTGIAFTSMTDGRDKSVVEYRHGVRWGSTKEWYTSGQPMVDAHYVRDALHGRAREWHANGQLAEDGEYEYGIARWSKQWDEDGTLTKSFVLTEEHAAWKSLLHHREMYGSRDDE